MRSNMVFIININGTMLKVLVLVLAINIKAGASPPEESDSLLDGKIIGGFDVTIDRHPYQLSLEYREQHSCGASLIGSKWVVTAAHCTHGLRAKDLQIRAGSSLKERGGQVVEVKKIYQHQNYSSKIIDYDISVLELAAPVSYKYAKPIPLAHAGIGIPEGALAAVTGWGTTRESGFLSRNLKVINIPIVSQSKCRSVYGNEYITDRMFCAGFNRGGKDACQGDSGGPLVIKGVLTGIVSWGYGCARPSIPGVYSSIPALRDFIKFVSGI